MAELMKHPPEQYKKRAKALAEEGKDIANIGCCRYSSKTVGDRNNIKMPCVAKNEVQANIVNSPFNGDHLLGKAADNTLQQIKKDNDTAKAKGALYIRVWTRW